VPEKLSVAVAPLQIVAVPLIPAVGADVIVTVAVTPLTEAFVQPAADTALVTEYVVVAAGETLTVLVPAAPIITDDVADPSE
jgi:hypothetical protein